MAGKHGKKSKASNLILDVIIVILIGVIAYSGFKVYTIMKTYRKGTEAYNKIAEEAQVTEKESEGLDLDWDKLQAKYDDIAGWLYCKGTVINYPVARGTDNSFYLHHLLNGNYDVKGTLFIDCRQDKPLKDFLTVIYGHHMFDGSMFGNLVKYRKANYFKKHPTMIYSTPKHDYKLRIFAGNTIPSDSDFYKFDFATKREKAEYLEKLRAESEIDSDLKVTADDKIVMLSTCTYEFEDARWVVYARLDETG